MTDQERKVFFYTLLNTKLNKESLDKAEAMSKKCIINVNKVHQEIFGSQYKTAEKIKKKREKGSSGKKVNFTSNIYHD